MIAPDVPLFKIIQRPLLPVADSWVDATPFVVFFILLTLVPFLMRLPQPYMRRARRAMQVLAAFTFIIFLHRCLCMLRGWVFALKIIGRNDIIAFGHLCMFVLLVALTLRYGRAFCGWICPLGFFLELLNKIARRRAALSRARRLLSGYLMLAGVALFVLWLAYFFRPGTQFFSENVAAVWGIGLLALVAIALPFEFHDRRLKRIKYLSMTLWIGLSAIGVFVTSPWCTLFGDELDYSSGVALTAVILAGLVIGMSWCRYVCPIGAALGWLAKFAPIRLAHQTLCSHCGNCRTLCPMAALDDGDIDQTSCIYCGECVGTCGFQWVNLETDSEKSHPHRPAVPGKHRAPHPA